MLNEAVVINANAARILDAQLAATISELRARRRTHQSANSIAKVAQVRLSMSKHMFEMYRYAVKVVESRRKPSQALPAPKKAKRA